MREELPKDWKLKRFDDFLDYIQPTPYIVESTEYDDSYKTPVLTAGKSFIKGYTNEANGIFNSLPVIIFDDFTTANKFVNFPFKVKSSAMKILKPKDENVNIKFVFYYMQTVRVSFDTHKRYWISVFSKLPIPSPPKSTQLAIVSKIEELFSELEKGIESLFTAKQQLKTYRQSVLKWAFEGKLTNGLNCDSFDLYDEHDLSIAAEPEVEYKTAKNHNNYKNQINHSSDKGELPKGWKWVKIDYLLSHPKKGMATGPFGTMLKKSEHQKSGVPVLGIENIGEGVFQMPNKIFVSNEKAIELRNFRVKENDIIISRSGTVGEICLLPKKMENSIISTNLIRVSLNLGITNPKYFVYLFQGGMVRQQVFDLCKGSSRAFLNQTILNSLDFPYCSTEEQHKVVQEIESRLSVADKMEESITQSLQQAEALKQSILKKAFEGKLI